MIFIEEHREMNVQARQKMLDPITLQIRRHREQGDPIRIKFLAEPLKAGISSLQGPHQVAQKLSTTSFPANSSHEHALPSRDFNSKGAATVPGGTDPILSVEKDSLGPKSLGWQDAAGKHE